MARPVPMWMVRAAAKAKAEGVFARKVRMPRNLCPYSRQQDYKRESWLEGWDETEAEDVRAGGKPMRVRDPIAEFIRECREEGGG